MRRQAVDGRRTCGSGMSAQNASRTNFSIEFDIITDLEGFESPANPFRSRTTSGFFVWQVEALLKKNGHALQARIIFYILQWSKFDWTNNTPDLIQIPVYQTCPKLIKKEQKTQLYINWYQLNKKVTSYNHFSWMQRPCRPRRTFSVPRRWRRPAKASPRRAPPRPPRRCARRRRLGDFPKKERRELFGDVVWNPHGLDKTMVF